MSHASLTWWQPCPLWTFCQALHSDDLRERAQAEGSWPMNQSCHYHCILITSTFSICWSIPVCFLNFLGLFKVFIIRIFSFSFVNLCNIASYLCQRIFKLPMSMHVDEFLRYGLIIIIVYWLFIFPSSKASLFECVQTFTHAYILN